MINPFVVGQIWEGQSVQILRKFKSITLRKDFIYLGILILVNYGSPPNFAFNVQRNLREWINFFSLRNHEKTIGFLISGGIEVSI